MRVRFLCCSCTPLSSCIVRWNTSSTSTSLCMCSNLGLLIHERVGGEPCDFAAHVNGYKNLGMCLVVFSLHSVCVYSAIVLQAPQSRNLHYSSGEGQSAIHHSPFITQVYPQGNFSNRGKLGFIGSDRALRCTRHVSSDATNKFEPWPNWCLSKMHSDADSKYNRDVRTMSRGTLIENPTPL